MAPPSSQQKPPVIKKEEESAAFMRLVSSHFTIPLPPPPTSLPFTPHANISFFNRLHLRRWRPLLAPDLQKANHVTSPRNLPTIRRAAHERLNNWYYDAFGGGKCRAREFDGVLCLPEKFLSSVGCMVSASKICRS